MYRQRPQYFHARRQAVAVGRSRSCASRRSDTCACRRRGHRADLTDGAFEVVVDDRATLDREAVSRVLLGTGKIAHELMDERDAQHAPVAVVRIEQLYPWPEAQIVAALDAYPNARDVWPCYVKGRHIARDGIFISCLFSVGLPSTVPRPGGKPNARAAA